MKKLLLLLMLLLSILSASAQWKVTDVKQDIVELTPEFINAIKKYDFVDEFSDGYAAVSIGHKSGFINTKGELAIPVTIDADCVGKFSEGLAIVIPMSSGEFYVIDKNGKTVFKGNGYHGTWDSYYIPYYINGKMYVQEDDKYQIYDRQGKKIGTADIDVGNNIYKNHEIGEYTIFSKSHNDRYDERDYDTDYRDQTFGLKDNSGKIVIAADYDNIQGQREGSIKISNGVVLVALTEYDENYDGGEDEHTRYHYGYADLKGNDTFSSEIKKRCITSKKNVSGSSSPQNVSENTASKLSEPYISSFNNLDDIFDFIRPSVTFYGNGPIFSGSIEIRCEQTGNSEQLKMYVNGAFLSYVGWINPNTVANGSYAELAVRSGNHQAAVILHLPDNSYSKPYMYFVPAETVTDKTIAWALGIPVTKGWVWYEPDVQNGRGVLIFHPDSESRPSPIIYNMK